MIFKKTITILCLFLIIFTSSSFVLAENSEPDLLSKAGLLIDLETGKILYHKNEEEKLYPASTTKILTAILTLENCKLDDVVTVNTNIAATIPYGYTTAELQMGEQLTVEQLLQILMVLSANDVANLLAIHMGGSVEGFAEMMNKKISELGLSNTHFTNPSGIHDDNHYTTAKDLASIMEYCIKNEEFRRFTSLTSCTIPATNKHLERKYESTDKLIVPSNSNYYPYVYSGKTGYTTEAGECLVSCASKDNLNLLCVVLGGTPKNGVSARFSDTKKLYEYGYNNYSLKKILDEKNYITQIEVANGEVKSKNLDLISKDSISVLLADSESTDGIEPTVNLNDNISAPINEGDVLGSVTYTVDGYDYKTDLIASHSVEKSYLFYYVIEILIGFVLIVVVYFILRNKKNKRRKRRKKKF